MCDPSDSAKIFLQTAQNNASCAKSGTKKVDIFSKKNPPFYA
jgi:hypothetical protein